MIPSRAEIVSSLFGAWRLFRMDPDSMRWFNTSMDGFWRSFFAAIIALPSFVLAYGSQVAGMESDPDPAAALLLGIIAYAASWVIFPVLAAFVVRPMGYSHAYVPYIVARNWAGGLVAQAYLVLEILTQVGVFSGESGGMVEIILFVVTLWYGWIVARIALATTATMATALVVLGTGLDLVIGYLLFSTL